MIAPGYTPEALAILSKKKGGNFIILEGYECKLTNVWKKTSTTTKTTHKPL